MESKSKYTVFIWKLFVISSNLQKIYKLLFIFFIIKLYARINVFKRLKKHGQDIYKLSKTLENQISKHLDISFIKQCKKENIIPTSAKVNVAITHGTYKLKRKLHTP